MKLIYTTLIVLATISLTSCPKTRTPMPRALRDKLIQNRIDKITDLATDYDQSIANSAAEKAKLDRDELISISLELIDANYNTFEDELFVGRATSNVLMDATELSLAAVTGFTHGERVKSILAIALTAFKGERKSIDLNYFRERTTELIALKMRAARARVRTDIYAGLKVPVAEYPLDAALDDLINYLHAGSVNSALLELAQDTGDDSKKAEKDASNTKVSRYLTKTVTIDFRAIRDAAETLRGKLIKPATRDHGRTEIQAVLRQLYEPNELAGLESKGDAELFGMLEQKIEDARDNEALRKKLMKALNLIQ